MATLSFTIKVLAQPPAAPTGLKAVPLAASTTPPSAPTGLKATPK
jgi:hypothetical protein